MSPESNTPITGVDFVALPTQDWEAAKKFYGETLGLPFRKQWGEMPAGEFQAGNLTVALMQTDAFGIDFGAHPGPIAFQVPDYDAARAELESRGVEFVSDTIDSGVCKQGYFRDPDGNSIGIHERYAEGSPPAAA